MSTYESWREFAASSGLFFFILLFVGVTAYALWPANREKFRRAAEAPLRED
jgi:cytochrome c oxidase cbb3-type subunit IV